jgi:5-methylcytosine-specific restriction endonuclease McrA
MTRPYVRCDPTLTKAEREKEWAKRYQAKYPERHRARLAANNLKRRDAIKAWYEANKDRRRATALAYREKKNAARRANREKAREYEARIRAEQPHKHRIKNANRIARELRATPLWLTVGQYRDMEEWYILGATLGLDVDHIVPLRGKTVCGLHVPWNLQLLTQSKNAAKGNRLLDNAADI